MSTLLPPFFLLDPLQKGGQLKLQCVERTEPALGSTDEEVVAQSLLKEEAYVVARGHDTVRKKNLSREQADAGWGATAATASDGVPVLADAKSGENWSEV
jgi:hypothetical protein